MLEPSKYDIPQDLYEYTWTELEETSVDTTNRTYIVVSENTSTTIIYFTPQQLTRPRRRCQPQAPTLSPQTQKIENNLASVKKFHRSNAVKLSTFHLDTARSVTTTDQDYLQSVLLSLNLTRHTYENTVVNKSGLNLSSLQQISDELKHIRTHLDKTLLSRQRYFKLRRYTESIHTRVQRLIDRIKDRKTSRQSTITQFFTTNPAKLSSAESSDRDLDNDQAEDYRGESD